MAKKGRRRSRWASEAAQQALVRFGPEESGIRAARRSAEDTFRTTSRQADATSAGIQAAISRVRPEVQHDYDAAGLQAARAAHVAEPDLAAANVPASLRAAVAAERSGFTSRLGESRAQSLTELSDRRVQAVEGAGFAKSNAQRVLASTLTQLFERAQDLAKEKGAFTASTASELHTAAQERAQQLAIAEGRNRTTRRGQTLSHQDRVRGQNLSHTDRQAAARKKARDGSGFGANGASNDKHIEWRSDIEEIAHAAAKYKGKLSREQIVAKLANGRPQRTVLVAGRNSGGYKTGDPLPEGLSGPEKVTLKAQKVTLPAQPAYKPDLRMSAALDVALSGYVGHETVRRLHASKFSVRQLGLPTRPRNRTERRIRRNQVAGPPAPGY
jgi:hypothetical protein